MLFGKVFKFGIISRIRLRKFEVQGVFRRGFGAITPTFLGNFFNLLEGFKVKIPKPPFRKISGYSPVEATLKAPIYA